MMRRVNTGFSRAVVVVAVMATVLAACGGGSK
jgi:hypothetical protein